LQVGVSTSVADIVMDLLNMTVNGTDSDDGEIWGIDPLWHETDNKGNSHVVTWVTFWRYPTTDFLFDAETLLPQGLFFKMDITGRDPSKWFLVGWLYNDIYYTSTDAFRKAWQSPNFQKLTPNYAGNWIGTDPAPGESMAFDTLPPPTSVQPAGPRFTIDTEEKFVEWMDWSFYITFTRDTGVRLYNIKFKNDTILYELGLQEAIAHYAGNDPVQSGTAYLDSYYGFGPYTFELVPGYDVPLHSTFLDTTFHAAEESITHRQSIAIFERDDGYPMQRHSSKSYVSATKNIALELRSVSTIGNYDYSFSYIWYQDGSIETVVRASGYIQSAFPVKNDGYGYKIHDQLSGSMHDHVLNFKADFDILGTSNSVAKHSIVAKEVKYPWSNTTRSTMQLERSYLKTEDEGKLDWEANSKSMIMVVNKKQTNKYGEERGYRVMPSRGGAGMHLTIRNSSNLLNSQGFATHQLYVTKRKDSELSASHPYNECDTANPIIDFNKYFNGESIDQEDIVLWYNLGMHHVPHTGDLPNTVMTTAQSGMMMTPHNYFSGSMDIGGDASRKSVQNIRINYGDAVDVPEVLTFGQQPLTGDVALDAVAWDPTTYSGEVAVRNFPYHRELMVKNVTALRTLR
jgi:primary-amine oxidase